jgi:hypothetical protein
VQGDRLRAAVAHLPVSSGELGSIRRSRTAAILVTYMAMFSPRSALLLATCLCTGCESKASVDFSPFHGLYQIDSDTLNSGTCDTEGAAVAGSKPLLVIFSLLTLQYGNLALADSCTDPVACRARAANPVPSIGTAADFGATFSRITSDGQGLTGTSLSLDIATGLDAQVYDNVLVRSGGSIRIESRTHELPCQTSGGKCDQTATIAAAASAPCTEFRVVVATFQKPL